MEDGRERGAKGESIVTKADDISISAGDTEECGGALLLQGSGDLFRHHLKLHFQIYQVFVQWILWMPWLARWVYPFFRIKFLVGEGTQIHHHRCRRSLVIAFALLRQRLKPPHLGPVWKVNFFALNFCYICFTNILPCELFIFI